MTELIDLLKPSFIKNDFGKIQVNDELNKVVMVVGYPRTIREGWLDSIISSEGNFDLSLHIFPSNIETTLTQLNRELVKQEADLLSSYFEGFIEAGNEYQSIITILEQKSVVPNQKTPKKQGVVPKKN